MHPAGFSFCNLTGFLAIFRLWHRPPLSNPDHQIYSRLNIFQVSRVNFIFVGLSFLYILYGLKKIYDYLILYFLSYDFFLWKDSSQHASENRNCFISLVFHFLRIVWNTFWSIREQNWSKAKFFVEFWSFMMI